MATGFLDELLIAAEVDPSGIARGLQDAITQLQQFDRSLDQILSQNAKLTVDVVPSIPTVNVSEFLSGLAQGIQEGLAEVQADINASPLTIPAPIIPPPSIPSPPDFSETITETIRAADVMRAEFLSAFPVQALGIEAKQAAAIAVDELESGLLARVGQLRDELATGLISPASFTAQVDRAIADMAAEIQRRNADLPTLVINTRVGAAQDAGVITDADLAQVQAFDQVAQAERRVTDEVNRGTTALGSHSRAANVARSSLTVLASQALGTSSTLGRLAESLLLFGGGTGLVVGVAGSVLVLSKAYDLLTKSAQEAEERHRSLVDNINNQRLHPGGVLEAQDAVKATTEEVRRLAIVLSALNTPNPPEEAFTLRNTIEEFQFVVGIKNVKEESLKVTENQRLAEQQLTEAIQEQARAISQAQAAQRQQFVGALAQAPTLGLDDVGSVRERRAEEERLLSIINNQRAGVLARVEAERQLSALIEGEQAPALRNLDLQQQAIQETLRAAAATGVLARAQADVTALAGFDQLIAQYQSLEKAAAGDATQVQALADKRHEVEKLRQSTDAALAGFLGLGAGVGSLPAIQLRAAFADPDQALLDLLAELNRVALANPVIVELKPLTLEGGTTGLVPRLDDAVSQSFEAASGSVGDLDAQLQRAITASGRFGATAVRDANDTRTAFQRTADAIDEVTRGLDEISRTASNVGAISQAADQAISSVLGLVDAVGNLRDELGNITAGGILGLVGAGVGVIGAVGRLFGKSQEEVERDRLLAENNQRLAELNSTIGQQVTGEQTASAAEIAAVAAAQRLAAIQSTPLGTGTGGLGGTATQQELDRVKALETANREFQDRLAAAGLTLDEFAQIIKQQTGLEILDSKGHVVAETLAQVDAAFQKTIQSITNFGDSIDAQAQVAETRDKLGLINRTTGLPDSADPDIARLQRIRDLELNNLNLSAAEDARIRALDLATSEGQQAFLEEQRSLFLRAQAGELTPEELGKFTSVTELLGIIGQAADGLNTLTDATRAAADQLNDFNLPSGFRAQAIAFETANVVPVAVPLPGGPEFASLRGSDGAALPDFTASIQSLTDAVRNARPIEVHQSIQQLPGESMTDFAERVVEALRTKANAQTGDTLLSVGFN